MFSRRLASLIAQAQARSVSTSSVSDLILPITVRTCIGLYPRLQQRHPHIFPLKVPTDGVELTVNYADTANQGSRSPSEFQRTIVALHGTPGHIEHFDQLLVHYRATRTRVIVPNFPDFSHTRSTGLFWHTTEEKVAFLKSFLEQLDVKKIDCLLAHSMGFQAATSLLENPGPIAVKSLALFAPQPTWDMTPQMHKFVRTLFLYRNELWFRLLELTKVYQSKRIAIKFATLNEFLWLMTTVRDLQTPVDALRRIYHLRKQSKIPVLVQFGSKEPIVSKRAATKIFEEFGVDKNLVKIDFNDNRDPAEIVPAGGPRVQGYLTVNGGHFAYAKQAAVTIRMIENLMQSAAEQSQ